MSKALSYEKEAVSAILRGIRNTVSLLKGKGNRKREDQKNLDAISMAVMNSDMKRSRLGKAVKRLTGLTKRQLKRGVELGQNYTKAKKLRISKEKETEKEMEELAFIKRKSATSGSKAKIDRAFIVDYFHHKCEHITVDKERNYTFKRLRCVIHTLRCFFLLFCLLVRQPVTKETMDCTYKVRTATKQQLVDTFKCSPEYRHWKKQNPGREIGDRSVGECICKCIKEKQTVECACPVCVKFDYLLQAWNMQVSILFCARFLSFTFFVCESHTSDRSG